MDKGPECLVQRGTFSLLFPIGVYNDWSYSKVCVQCTVCGECMKLELRAEPVKGLKHSSETDEDSGQEHAQEEAEIQAD